ncbi:MAG TPA: tRNA epoxyqueuosine(34) reductase QueG [Bacteroidota bacterium]|nr:tRNA epoxyqueuosine(34) reductase QueG [Bacteroidota bacterium]
MNGLKDYIRNRARGLGIDLVGFAAVSEPGPERGRLEEWLSEGRHGTMAWLEKNRERRSDPRLVLPGVKSIVSVGLNYHSPHHHAGSPGAGKVSRYAWGDDYHDVLGRRLEELLAGIRELDPSIGGKVYVDTGPVMEKAWAQRAGLGWQGKHTNLISQELGSWLFLGEILLTAEIEPDVPETDHCGNCTLCIEACPTGAITEPYVLDARLCISYLTIENRGPIPGELRDRLDGWIYGCDACQDVCPWNDRAVDCGDPAFGPREGNIDRDLREVLEMGEAEFRAEFTGSPIRRTRHGGFRRNALALLEWEDHTAHTTTDNHGT